MIRALVPLLAGFVVWSAAFVGIYALQAIGCAMGWPSGLLRGLLATGAAVAALACAGIVVLAFRQRGILRLSAVCAAVAALVATVLTFSGVFWMQVC